MSRVVEGRATTPWVSSSFFSPPNQQTPPEGSPRVFPQEFPVTVDIPDTRILIVRREDKATNRNSRPLLVVAPTELNATTVCFPGVESFGTESFEGVPQAYNATSAVVPLAFPSQPTTQSHSKKGDSHAKFSLGSHQSVVPG